jgi:hypothetical protein
MNELLRKRIDRHLANLSDEQGYQLLDYVEFLETKYGTADRTRSTFERFTEGVEDALRAGRLPAAAIRETMGAVDTASRMLQRLAEAGRSAVDEVGRSFSDTSAGSSQSDEAPTPASRAEEVTPTDDAPTDMETPPSA